jgi:hypothetical protein
MSIQGREHVKNNYNWDVYKNRWIELVDNIVETQGSWDTRQGYQRWHLLEVA